MIENKNIYKGNENPNIESKKLDSNGEEIVWELRSKSISFAFLWSIIVRGGIIFFGIYICYHISNSLFISFLAFIVLVAYNTFLLVMTLNLKSIFITTKNLILKKHIGQDLVLSLGEFYCDDESEVLGLTFDSIITIRPIFDNKILPYYLFLDCLNTNIDEIFGILKESIENRLAILNETEYNQFRNINKGFLNNYIDFSKIDKLREEKQNND